MSGKRIYDVNENYFNNWSHSMAYILGFISADGSVNKEKSSLSIELQVRDKEILEYLQYQISPNSPIKTTKKKNKEYCRLRINSVKLIQSLRQYNVIPNKTYVLRLDFSIPNEYIGDYLRGLFDGDGWVYCRRNTIEVGFCSGSPKFLDDIKERIGYGRIRIKTKGKFITYVLDAEANSAIALRSIMYADNRFSLKRKRDIMFSDFYKPSLRWWTEEQIQYLKDNFKPKTKGLLDQLCHTFDKSRSSVSKKIWELGLAR